MRSLLAALAVLAASFVPAFAQSTNPVIPSLTVTAQSGDVTTAHRVTVSKAVPGSAQTVVVFDPAGDETVLRAPASSTGDLSWNLAPPDGGWQVGLYRVVLSLGDGRSTSETFVAGDGQPHIFALPYQPSPTSALNFVGIGLVPNATVALTVLLSGAQGQRTIPVSTDASGSFSIFVWPQEFGFPFFAAGDYRIEAPGLGLATNFELREHPMSASMGVQGPVVRDATSALSLQHYRSGRMIWGVYVDSDGKVSGELLLGPVDIRGSIAASVHLAAPVAGTYYLATPYDWGETAFVVVDPTSTITPIPPSATPTSTPTATSTATATPRPTAKATAKPKPVAHRTKTQRCVKARHGKKRGPVCKRHK